MPVALESVSLPATNPLTICGSARTYLVGEDEFRDTDGYKFTVPGTAGQTMTVTADAA